jgi:WD40 repeat protein
LQKGISRDLESICLRCLRKRPEDRYATAQDVAVALQNFLDGFPQGKRSWLTRALYFVRRNRTLCGAACAALLLLTTVSGLYAWTSWLHRLNEATIAFKKGVEDANEGRIAEGYDQMRAAMDMLPWGESVQRGYFARAVAAREASMIHQVARLPHTSEIMAAAASADGRYMLVGDLRGATILWDLAENTTHVLPARRDRKWVTAVAFNRAGTLCSSGGFDCVVTVWDVQTRQVIWSHQFDHIVRSLAFIGGGDRLLTATAETNASSLRMWEVLANGGKEVRLESEGARPEMTADLVASPTGDRFVSITATNHCLLWDARSGRVLADLSEGAGADRPLGEAAHSRAAFSADGSRLAVAGTRLTLHDGRTGAVLRPVDAGRWDGVNCVGFRDDGGLMLVVNAGRATALRRLTSDADVYEDVPMDRPTDPTEVTASTEVTAFTEAGLILTGRRTRTLRILKPPPFALLHTDLGPDIVSARVVVSGDGSRIATLTVPRWTPSPGPRPPLEEVLKSQKARVQVWDSRALRPLSRAAGLPGGHFAATIAYGPVADTLALGCIPKTGRAPVFVGTLGPDGIITYDHLGDHASNVGAMAFTPDGKALITGSAPLPGVAPAELIGWAVGVKPAFRWRVEVPAAVTAIAVSPDGANVLVGDSNGSLTLRPLDRPLEVLTAVDLGQRIFAAAFAHHAPLVAVTHSADQVGVLEASDTTLALRSRFDQPGATPCGVAFGANDDILYVASDKGVQRWDVEVMKRLDPVITFTEDVRDFRLNSRPEAMIAVTRKGQLILRTVPDSGPVHRAVVGPRPMPVDAR